MNNNGLNSKFIYMWKSSDFINYNEADIREDFIAPLLKILGYSKRTVNDIIREKSLSLSTPYHRIGRKKISVDYIPSIRLKSFWLIEAKPGNTKEMDYGDLLQAHLYATHPEVQVPFIVLCNGWDLKIYDSLRLTDWNEPIFSISQQDCEVKFQELQEILGVKNMLIYQRKRILENIKNTFAAEIDINQLDSFRSEFNDSLIEMSEIVRENERSLEMKAWKDAEKQEEIERQNATLEQLLIHMDIMGYHMRRAANEYIKRIEQADLVDRVELINLLVKKYRERSHSVFKVNVLNILLSLLSKNIEIKGELYFENIKVLIEEIATCNLTYFEDNSLFNALCHLENSCCRLSKKIAMKIHMDELSEKVEDMKKSLAIEDLIANRPNVTSGIERLIRIYAEWFWSIFYYENNVSLIWEGVWGLEYIESVIDKLPEKEYPKNEGDVLFFESYGRDFDLLFVGSWMSLNENIDCLRKNNISSNIMNYASMDRESAISKIPKAEKMPSDYKLSIKTTERIRNVFNSTINIAE